jgi:hypothetical protein
MQVNIAYSIISNENRVKHPKILPKIKKGLIYSWLLYIPGIGYGIIEKNRATAKSKFPQKCKDGDFWATGGYICGRWATGNLVIICVILHKTNVEIKILCMY